MTGRIVRAALVATGVWAALAVAPARATIVANPGCVDDVSGSSNNCTANDVTFVLVGLGVQQDGCVSGDPAEGVSIRLRATLRNTTAQTRYDIGMYLANDGDPNGDGARTGGCARQHVTPVGGTGVTTCGVGALDLDGPLSGVDLNAAGVADGPFLSAETGGNNSTPDGCGDLFAQGNSGCDENGDGRWDDTVFDFPTAITFPCRDVENDGFVNIPTCATWGNQANEVHSSSPGDSTCDSEAEIVPGTPAKCRCEDTNTTIPSPRLSLACSCTPTTVQPGQSATCSVTYTNNSSCTPDLATPERFRCGTAGFVRFRVNYSAADGSVSNLATAGTGGGGAAVDDGSGQITWTPTSGNGTAGLVGPNGESATLTYTYTVGPNPPNPQVTIQTQTYWSDSSSFSPEVLQSTLTCGVTLTTPVTLAQASASWQGGRAVVEWATASEAGNAGFNLYTAIDGRWVRVNDRLIPSRVVDSTAPQRYRYPVGGAVGGRFAIEDVAIDGRTRRHPAFAIGETRGRTPDAEPIDWRSIRAGLEAAEPRAVGAASTVRAPGGAPGFRVTAGPVDLGVRADGLYRLTYDDLAAAGIDLGMTPVTHLALTDRGAPMPMRVVGAGTFGPGEFIEFYGQGLDTLYTDTNVYRFGADRRAARRVAVDNAVAAGAPAAFYLETVEVARQRGYSFGSPIDDPWYDTRLFAAGAPVAQSIAFNVDHYQAGAAAAALTVELWGSTSWPANPDHHVVIALNGVPVADELFDGRVAHTVSLALPPGLLVEGPNTVTVELPADRGVPFEIVHLEGFRVGYPRAFAARDGRLRFTAAGDSFRVTGLPGADVVAYRVGARGTELLAGVRVTGKGGGFSADLPGSPEPAEYLVSTTGALAAPTAALSFVPVGIASGRADYLVISHPLFRRALDRLVTMHESRGLAVRVVDVNDVYALFGFGIFDPAAIHDYIAHAVAAMGTRYVLLVGGDTYDYRGYLGNGSVSFIPSPYAATGEIITFAPVDSLYADVDGDGVQDVAIGRLPVRTLGELETLIDKTLAYAGKNYGRTSVLAADAFDPGTGISFSGASEDFQRALGEGWDVQRAYLDWTPVAGARELLLDALNDGVAVASFVGHSGPTMWTFSGLFHSNDAAALSNAGRPAVVVQWGCWNTYHVEPAFNTLGHALLLSGDRGAAAVLGSATLLETDSAEAFARHLGPLLAQPGTTIGEAVQEAKVRLAIERPELHDILLGWTLLGDPGLVVEP